MLSPIPFWVLIGIRQRVHGAVLIEIQPSITKALVSTRNRIEALVADSTRWIFQGGVVGVGERDRVSSSWCRFFNVDP